MSSLRRARVFVWILMVLLIGVFVTQPMAPKARAQSQPRVAVDPGRIADLSITTGSTVQFAVNLIDAPAINGFVVVLSYNPHILEGVRPLDYSGNVLQSYGTPHVLRDCVDGGDLQCFLGAQPPDQAGTTSLSLVLFGQTTAGPTNGLLFRETFNVVGTGFTQLRIVLALISTGVILPDGTPEKVPVATSDGYFSNIDCPQGSGNECVPAVPDFTWSPLTPRLGDVVSFNASASLPAPGATITDYRWSWEDGTGGLETAGSIVQHTFTSFTGYPIEGRFFVTLTVTDSFDLSTSITKQVVVGPKPDFNFEPNSNGLDLLAGKAASLIENLTSVNGFEGIVNLAITVLPHSGPANVTASLVNTYVILQPGKTNGTSIIVSASSASPSGSLSFLLTGTSGPLIHSVVIGVNVERPTALVVCDIASSSYCSDIFAPFSVVQGGNVSFPVFVERAFGYNGTVTLSTSCSAPGIVSIFTPVQVTLDENHATVPVIVRISISERTPPGMYCQVIKVSGLGIDDQYGLDVEISVAPPPLPADFELNAQPSLKIITGSNATIALNVMGLNGFSDNVHLLAWITALNCSLSCSLSDNPPLAILNTSKVSLAGEHSIVVPLEIVTGISTLIGNYTLAIAGSAFSSNPRFLLHVPFHVIVVSLRVVPPPAPPVLAQLHWKHRVSLSIAGLGKGTQTFIGGVYNTDNSTTLYARLVVTGRDQTGTRTFRVSSQVETILPQQSLENIQTSQAFDQSTIGSIFTFKVIVMWGVDPNSLSQTSTISSGPANTGSFRIIP